MKQTHRKVRSGCIACKERRIKCDELKPQCSYCLKQIAKNRQLSPCCYPEGTNIDIASTSLYQDETIPSPTSGNCLSIISQYGWPTAGPAEEKRLLQHICYVRSDLDNIIDLDIFAGATQWNGIAAGHLRTLYKSTTEHKVECQYRTKAIGEMATQLDAVLASPQQDHKESSQALLASTILMAWYSNTR
ncbi:Uncharacterized protein HZ326_8884 [Fusarium oxysporum f. sp. albedinis]|nr:Uncharacterized protein HZ326_8884 [Fusarium oxysporum f. sp. albedinis]